jgi:hypothetical protein
MAMYTSIIGRRTQITLTDRQHGFLSDESRRTGLAMAELVRRALDATYRPYARRRLRGVEFSLGVWHPIDEGLVARRVRRKN